MTPRFLRAPAAVLAAVALAGCNESPRIGDEEYIANTVETLLRVCATGDGLAVEDILAYDTRRRFLQAGSVLEGCRQVIGLADPQDVPGSALFLQARVVRVTHRGDQAFATIRASGREARVHLLDTGLKWFVSNPPLYEPVGEEDVP